MKTRAMPGRGRTVEAFGVLSDTTRWRLVQHLAASGATVGKLAQTLKLPQPAVSHHLGILRMNGFVTARREGRFVHYRLVTDRVRSLADALGLVLLAAGK